jgi:hypothetical protein
MLLLNAFAQHVFFSFYFWLRNQQFLCSYYIKIKYFDTEEYLRRQTILRPTRMQTKSNIHKMVSFCTILHGIESWAKKDRNIGEIEVVEIKFLKAC